ncbi:unnamed protein product [Spirodela intermedia]|uniref:phosphopyruvate hydratase n=1 Tax=Spirodela intermedia TaxID=51605 RepID=A0A7I8K0D2_SPIIN|nr:unnamed protein product [Spirodela intermedia]
MFSFPLLLFWSFGQSNHMRRAVSSAITKIKARQILDSKGIPTVEVDMYTNKGMFRAAAPSGDLDKIYERSELRDGDKGKYLGNSVSKAVRNINEKIAEALIGMDPTLQSQIDHTIMDLDKTESKAINAMLAVSMAACKAGAAEKEVLLCKHIADLSGQSGLILPVPAITVISGGKHAGNNLAAQEIMILPVGANTFEEAMQMGSETYYHLKAIILEKYGSIGCNVGEDGGNKYDMDFKSPDKSGQVFKTGEEMAEMYAQLCTGTILPLVGVFSSRQNAGNSCFSNLFCLSDYPIVSIEDPFDRNDWLHTKAFTDLGLCQVVGDHLLSSDPKRLERAIDEASCNGLLLKINQVGTVTDAIEVAKQAKDGNWGVVISHRSGETEDSFIADLAVAPCRGERVAKYNQLLRIEEELGEQAVYAGENWRSP